MTTKQKINPIIEGTDKAIANLVNMVGQLKKQVDGRVFRDCAWSYDVIFQLVLDKQLLEDYSKACSYKTY